MLQDMGFEGINLILRGIHKNNYFRIFISS